MIGRALSRAGVLLVVGLVMLYRVTLGQVMGGQCRYVPTCSQYMMDAVQKHGVCRGVWMGVRRIGRCHPWGGAGYDPP